MLADRFANTAADLELLAASARADGDTILAETLESAATGIRRGIANARAKEMARDAA